MDQFDVQQKSVSLDAIENDRRLKLHRIIVFATTFIAYASVHATRTAYAYAGPELKQEFSEKFYGWVNFSFLISLGISMKILGRQGDQMNLSRFVSVGMFGAAIVYLVIGLLGNANKINQWEIVVLMSISGIFQSTCWPGSVAIMGNWFGKGSRGLLMGIWAGNSNFGNIIGDFFGYLTLTLPNPSLGWPWCLIVASIFLGTMALVQILILNPYPAKIGITIPIEDAPSITQPLVPKDDASIQRSQNNDTFLSQNESTIKQTPEDSSEQETDDTPITFFNVWLVPNVPLYAIAYACLQSSSYGLLFWMPNYLNDNKITDNQAYILAMNDIGTFLGGIVTGIVSDRVGKRAMFMSPMLLISALCMLMVRLFLHGEPAPYYFALFFIGFFLGGPYNIISSCIAIDLAQQPYLQKQKSAITLISSVIEGLGSICAAVTQVVIPLFPSQALFFIFTLLCTLSALTLVPIALRDVRELKEQAQQ